MTNDNSEGVGIDYGKFHMIVMRADLERIQAMVDKLSTLDRRIVLRDAENGLNKTVPRMLNNDTITAQDAEKVYHDLMLWKCLIMPVPQ